MTLSQSLFTAALLSPETPPPSGLQDGRGRSAERRFSVYRNNVTVSLIDALHEGFPAISSLLGKENMDGLARIYLRQHPPTSPLMMLYGAEFPEFLAGVPQLSHLGYLADVARLELALRHAYHAADVPGIRAERLAGLSPEALMGARVSVAPAVSVLRSDWPVLDIWRFASQSGEPTPREHAQNVLITRPEFDPIAQSLPPGGALWIEAVLSGATIGDAYDTVLDRVADFDLSPTLSLLLNGGAIVALIP